MSIFVFKNFLLLIAGPAAWAFLSSIRDLIKRKSCQENLNTNHKIIFKIWRSTSVSGGFLYLVLFLNQHFWWDAAGLQWFCPAHSHVTVCTLFYFTICLVLFLPPRPTVRLHSVAVLLVLICSAVIPRGSSQESAFSVQMYWDDLCITSSQSKNANDKKLWKQLQWFSPRSMECPAFWLQLGP